MKTGNFPAPKVAAASGYVTGELVLIIPGGQHGASSPHLDAQQLIQQGYHGCWVLALGTNDTADVYVGSQVSLAKDSWFISDGIHYTSAGYAARAHLIARALAAGFPDRDVAAKNGHTDPAGEDPPNLRSPLVRRTAVSGWTHAWVASRI